MCVCVCVCGENVLVVDVRDGRGGGRVHCHTSQYGCKKTNTFANRLGLQEGGRCLKTARFMSRRIIMSKRAVKRRKN